MLLQRIVGVLLLALTSILVGTVDSVPAAKAETAASPGATAGVTDVKVFLIALGNGRAGQGTIGCGDRLAPVVRQVPATRAPLGAALRSLLTMHQRTYGQSGLYNSLYRARLTLNRVRVMQGVATIYLRGTMQLDGECDTPRAKAQLRSTALQFATVRHVTIYINGVPMERALSLRG